MLHNDQWPEGDIFSQANAIVTIKVAIMLAVSNQSKMVTDKRRWSSSPHHLSQPIFSEHSLGTPMLLKKNPFPPSSSSSQGSFQCNFILVIQIPSSFRIIMIMMKIILIQIPSSLGQKESLSYDSPSTRLSLESVAIGWTGFGWSVCSSTIVTVVVVMMMTMMMVIMNVSLWIVTMSYFLVTVRIVTAVMRKCAICCIFSFFYIFLSRRTSRVGSGTRPATDSKWLEKHL